MARGVAVATLEEEGCGIGVGAVSQRNWRRWRGVDKRGFEAEKRGEKREDGARNVQGKGVRVGHITSQIEVGAKLDPSPADNTILQQNKTKRNKTKETLK